MPPLSFTDTKEASFLFNFPWKGKSMTENHMLVSTKLQIGIFHLYLEIVLGCEIGDWVEDVEVRWKLVSP